LEITTGDVNMAGNPVMEVSAPSRVRNRNKKQSGRSQRLSPFRKLVDGTTWGVCFPFPCNDMRSLLLGGLSWSSTSLFTAGWCSQLYIQDALCSLFKVLSWRDLWNFLVGWCVMLFCFVLAEGAPFMNCRSANAWSMHFHVLHFADAAPYRFMDSCYW
jgi:hypothetical protein